MGPPLSFVHGAWPCRRQALLTRLVYVAPMNCCTRRPWIRLAAPLGLVAALALAPLPLHAAEAAGNAAVVDDTTGALDAELPATAEVFPAHAAVRALIEKEAATTGLPADIAEAVVFVESRYDSLVIGRAGEIGLMQVRPETAAMLGFRGTTAELAEPAINIRYGVIYLAKAWRLAGGDLCRALMKYRAGHGEEIMTPRSTIYCNRARNRLVAMNSPFARPGAAASSAAAAVEPAPTVAPIPARITEKPRLSLPARPTTVYATFRRGTAAASRAFWAAQEARIRAIKARVEARWHRVASR